MHSSELNRSFCGCQVHVFSFQSSLVSDTQSTVGAEVRGAMGRCWQLFKGKVCHEFQASSWKGHPQVWAGCCINLPFKLLSTGCPWNSVTHPLCSGNFMFSHILPDSTPWIFLFHHFMFGLVYGRAWSYVGLKIFSFCWERQEGNETLWGKRSLSNIELWWVPWRKHKLKFAQPQHFFLGILSFFLGPNTDNFSGVLLFFLLTGILHVRGV